MKREELKDLGLEEGMIEKIMGLHQIDVEAHKTVLANKDGEISTLKTNIKDLSNQVKVFDGVDVEKLKQTANDWEVKYNQDLTKEKTKHAVNLFIAKSGVKNEKALQGFLNHENIKLNEDGTLSGLSEQIETIKKDNPYLFVDSSQPKDINLGDNHSNSQGKEITNLADAISDYYGK